MQAKVSVTSKLSVRKALPIRFLGRKRNVIIKGQGIFGIYCVTYLCALQIRSVKRKNMHPMNPIHSLIFDLDGTLLNTIADLAHSTNYALEKSGFPTHAIEAYKYFVGNGINKLFERALPEGERTQENIARIRSAFLTYYDAHNADYTAPYPGIPELLIQLQADGMALAVASNKYQRATEKLVRQYFPDIRFAAVFGQREGIPTKPDPTVVRDVLQITGCTAEETLYVGDSGVDMQTAANGGLVSIGVTWGFRPRAELKECGARHIVDSPDEIHRLVFG